MIFAAIARPSRGASFPAHPPVVFVFIAAAPRPLRLRRGQIHTGRRLTICLVLFCHEHALRDQEQSITRNVLDHIVQPISG